jgi:hypothetical protein
MCEFCGFSTEKVFQNSEKTFPRAYFFDRSFMKKRVRREKIARSSISYANFPPSWEGKGRLKFSKKFKHPN